MTTPYQTAPDGAYVITDPTASTGSNYAQGLNDQSAVAMMLSPFTLITNPLGVITMLADTLMKLPLEVIQLFAPMIPGFTEGFETVLEGVTAITDFLQSLAPMLLSAFEVWVETAFDVLNTVVQQVIAILQGLIVEPVNAAVGLVAAFIKGITVRGTTNTSMILDLQAQLSGMEGGIYEEFLYPDQPDISGPAHLNYGPANQGSIGILNNQLYFHAGITASDQTEFVVWPDRRIGSTLQETYHLFTTGVYTQGDCTEWVPLRSGYTTDTTQYDAIFLKIKFNKVYFAFVLNGVFTELTAANTGGLLGPINYVKGDAEIWRFRLGDPDKDIVTETTARNWTWRVWRNNTELTTAGGVVFDLTTLNAGASVFLDADHDYRAVGMTADGAWYFPIPPVQFPPTAVEAMRHQVPAATPTP